jgi:hypothetical protein
MPSVPLTSSDAWLLHAILLAEKSGDASLEDVVSDADLINHAVLTFDEIDEGVARLSQAGFITVVKKRFRPTLRATQLLKGVRDLAIRKGSDTVRARLGVPEPSRSRTVVPSDPGTKSGAFTATDYAKVVKSYLKKVRGTQPR